MRKSSLLIVSLLAGSLLVTFNCCCANETRVTLQRIFHSPRYGFITQSGAVVVPGVWDYARDFCGDMAAVCVETTNNTIRWGFIRTDGKVMIEPTYVDVGSFSCGLAPARLNTDGKWGFLDFTGRVIIPFVNDHVEAFRGDMAAVKCQGRWGIVGTNGCVIVPYEYDWGDVSQDGATVIVRNGRSSWLLDRNGKRLHEFVCQSATFVGQYVAVEDDGMFRIYDRNGKDRLNGTFRRIDAQPMGDIIIKNVEHKAAASPGWQVFDALCHRRFAISADEIGFADEDRYWVREKNEWRLVDSLGTEVSKTRFAHIGPFVDELAGVGFWTNGVIGFGYINKQGVFELPPVFDYGLPFRDGIALVHLEAQWLRQGRFPTSGHPLSDAVLLGGFWAYIDRKGKAVWFSPQTSACFTLTSTPLDRNDVDRGRLAPFEWAALMFKFASQPYTLRSRVGTIDIVKQPVLPTSSNLAYVPLDILRTGKQWQVWLSGDVTTGTQTRVIESPLQR